MRARTKTPRNRSPSTPSGGSAFPLNTLRTPARNRGSAHHVRLQGRPEPAQRQCLAEIRDNLLARIDEARREGWLGEVEGLKVSLVGAQEKLAQVEQVVRRGTAIVNLGIPTIGDVARISDLAKASLTAVPQEPFPPNG